MKTLYVSDLDGTLLRGDETTSPYTNEVVNRLTEAGMIFSYATARSYHTARKVARGITARIPLIVYNGAFIIDNATGETIEENYFGEESTALLSDLIAHGVYPIVYGRVDGVERFSYVPSLCSRGELDFVAQRRGDLRDHPVGTVEELYRGRHFYFTCIDEEATLLPLYEKYRHTFHCVFQRDIYSGEPWLEIMPAAATKANAIRRLKAMLGCDHLVVFGDGKNDVDMFELADESYAVQNAVPELKRIATGVIGGNEEDGVARWLEERFAGRA